LTYSEPEYVSRQYSDASNLNARIALHARFSTNPYGLPFGRRVSELPERLERELTSRGAIHITNDTGLLIARR
jgi:hypothetical protein